MTSIRLHPRLVRGTNYLDFEKNTLTPFTPPPTRTAIWGTGDGTSVGEFNTRQDPDLHSRAFYYYGNQAGLRWSAVSSINSTRDIVFQTKETTRAAFDSMLASFPSVRTGKVFLHYFNEPEDNMSAAAYTAVVAQLYAAIDAANKPYVIKSAELNAYKLLPIASWNEAPYVPAGCQHIGWSVYAGYKVVNGHATYQYAPTLHADKIKAFHTTGGAAGIPWSVFAWGQGLRTAELNDTQSHINRAAWAQASGDALISNGAERVMWYDRIYGDADYRIAPSPQLLAWWMDPSRAGGQP